MNYKNFLTDEEMSKLEENKCFPLVKELSYKYNLSVFHYESSDLYQKDKIKVYMCNENGLVVNYVSYCRVDKKYEYYSPYVSKSRGRTYEDKHTYSSNKLSPLMRTIKENGLCSMDNILHNMHQKMTYTKGSIFKENVVPTIDRTNFNEDEFIALLSYATGGGHGNLNREKCKIFLDKYSERDRIEASNLQTLKDFVHKPFFAIASDDFRHTMVGAFRIKEGIDLDHFNATNIMQNIEVIVPMSRYKKVEDSPLQGLYPMFKTYFESYSQQHLINGIQPIDSNRYIPELDMFVTSGSCDKYSLPWMFTPC